MGIMEAYAEIELPYFPSNAYMTVETDRRRETFVCGEPVDTPYNVALELWNGIVAAALGHG